MHQLLIEMKEKIEYTNNTFTDSIRLLNEYKKYNVEKHSKCVADEAGKLATIFGESSKSAKLSGILHDISAVIPNEKKIEVAESLHIDVLCEEREFPLVIHQKLSREISRVIFGITNEQVLDAIGCHTTLKVNPSKLDMILFIADKLKWDQSGTPPYYEIVQKGLNESLEHGVFAFVKYLYKKRTNLKIVHPWLVDAYNYLNKTIESN